MRELSRPAGLVSIVVPTFNEERNIGRLLASIERQVGVNREVIVVDQSSSDSTVEIAAAHQCRVIRVARPRFYAPPGQSRNLGAAVASGDVLLHLDADMELPDSSLLQRLLGFVDESHEAAILHEEDVATGFWNRCKAVERMCYWDTNLEAARAVTKTLFDRVGGYHGRISSGEDYYVSKRYQLETTLVAHDTLVVHHHTGSSSLGALLKKKFQYGKSARAYLDIARDTQGVSWSRMVVTYLGAYAGHASLVLRDPIHFCGIFPLRLMEFGALLLGLVVGSGAHWTPGATAETLRGDR